MEFNVWTFLFEVLNFVVLAFVLHRLLYRPLRAAIDRRKDENNRARNEAEAARQEAEATKALLDEKLAETDRARLTVLREAAEQAAAEKKRQLSEAEAAAATVRLQARNDAEQIRGEAIKSLKHEVGDLALGVAGRLLAQIADAAFQPQFIGQLAETIRRIPEGEREQIRRESGAVGVMVESASPFDEQSSSDLIAALRELLGTDPEVRYEVKPALIGGALVRFGGHVWDATVAAQLEAARAAVAEADDANPR